jgi:hypothetical protein
MENIKFVDLVEKIEDNIPLNKCGIEVYKYLDIISKDIMINGYSEKGEVYSKGIVEGSIIEVDGIATIDYISLEILITLNIIQNYTNIDFQIENGDLTCYDVFKSKGIYNYVTMEIPHQEINFTMRLIEDCLKSKIQSMNSAEAIIAKYLGLLIEKIPSETKLKNMIGKIKDFDMDKLNVVKDLYNIAQGKTPIKTDKITTKVKKK